jgi:hypothetical protein
MGLDMYLQKKTYIGNKWKDKGAQLKFRIKGIKSSRVQTITEEVAYWRKANQIHIWFVKNVQNGEDDCKEYYVDRKQLQTLLDTVEKVLLSPNLAESLMPTSSGFFFGGTDYDKYYFQDLKYTKRVLKKILKEKGDGDFYYDSSW